MSEQNSESPKVSVKERLLDAAGKANEAIYEAVDAVIDETKVIIGKVKDYDALSPEEKKAKQDEWKAKASDVAEKLFGNPADNA